ncbi:MAG: thioredoxin [Actinobacteria bacterium]|nr:thioredoxin [Actinomycetota bacterium]
MIDVTDSTFETLVVQRSNEVPVVVDLWASWCGPCKVLGPILEKVVNQTNGKVELAKVDVDKNPNVAAAFSVQSIPAVYALYKGKVVDSFIGALPENQVSNFISALVTAHQPSQADKLVELGDEASLRKALEIDPHHEGAILALAELLVHRGDVNEKDYETALQLLSKIPESKATSRLAAMARLGAEKIVTQDMVQNSTQGMADMEDHLLKLLDNVKNDSKARQEFLDILAILDDQERVLYWRKELTSRLY